MPPLSSLIRLPAKPLISIVGAGGKTTTMYTLAAEFAAQGKRVITTTTTNIYIPRSDETDTLVVSAETLTLLRMVNAAWGQHRRVTVAGKVIDSGKLGGVQLDQPYALLQEGEADVVIVEADGARHSMIKAPAEYEPVVPEQTNVALIVMSAGAINQPLSAEIAHRPERIAALLGIKQGDVLTPVLIARLMTHELGGVKNIPLQAAKYLLLTNVAVRRLDVVADLVSLIQGMGRVTGVCCSARVGEWFIQGR